MTTDIVFSHAIGIYAGGEWQDYAVLQSTIHETWARKYSGSLETRLRYSPSDCFENFPFPVDCSALESIGEIYHEHRCQLMLKMQLGLTKSYNLFHDTDLSLEAVEKTSKQNADIATDAYDNILKLRDLHRQMDEAVLAAYGWHETSEKWGPAIDLRHNFYEVDYLPENDRTRYTIHPDARREVLKRLLLLNHERYEEEASQGLHDKKNKKKRTQKVEPVATQHNLFGGEAIPPQPAVATAFALNEVANLPDGEWVRTVTTHVDDETAALTAVLKTMNEPVPARQVRLAAMLAMVPRLLTPSLTDEEARHWQRLIGPEAEPLDTGITQLQPAANHAWGAALRHLRGTGRLIEDIAAQTWAPGQGLEAINTNGWPEGRVGMVLYVMQRRGVDEIVQTLPDTYRDWIDVRAA